MARLLRALGIAVAVGLASLVLGTCAYLGGCWPQRLSVVVEGPAGWRLTRIDDRECDEPLPTRVSKYLGFRPDGKLVAAHLEAAGGAERGRCRVRAWNIGGFKSGHQALPRAVESLDGSLWLLGDWKLTVHPRVTGHAWFGCETNGRKTLTIDGATSVHTNVHAASLSADGRASHTIDGGGWGLTMLVDAGTVVHVAEWPEPQGALIHCDDAGFSSGTLAIDGAVPSPVALDRPIEVAGRQFELLLKASDGSSARVRLYLTREGLNLRVSR